MEQPQIEMIVRVTARLSTTAFVAALVCFAFRARSRAGSRVHTSLFGLFLLAHTIHFGAVLRLAALTDGRNIQDRGGWSLMLIVASLFYLSCLAVLSAWGDRARGRALPLWRLLAAHAGIVFVTAIYLNSYLARAEGAPVYWLPVAALCAAAAIYFRASGGAAAARAEPPSAAPVR